MPPKKWMPAQLALFGVGVAALLVYRYALDPGVSATVAAVIGSVSLAAAVIGRFLFWKCPACGVLLPTHAVNIKECPKCGRALG